MGTMMMGWSGRPELSEGYSCRSLTTPPPYREGKLLLSGRTVTTVHVMFDYVFQVNQSHIFNPGLLRSEHSGQVTQNAVHRTDNCRFHTDQLLHMSTQATDRPENPYFESLFNDRPHRGDENQYSGKNGDTTQTDQT